MHKFRWGVIGTGRIADWFCADLTTLPDVELMAIGSRTHSAAEAFSRRHRAKKAYGSYEEVYADLDVDAVYIATPHSLHLQNSRDALRAGKAVLCEKPLTQSPEEARALVEIWRASGGYLMEAMWTYFLPAVQKAAEWAEAGRIGQLRHVRADFGYPVAYAPSRREYDVSLGGGCMLEMGIYPVALAWLFAKRAPVKLDVVARTAPNGAEDDVSILFDYGDAVAELAASFRCRLPNAAFIVGDAGYIVIPDAFRADECHLHVLDERIDSFHAPRQTRGYDYQAKAFAADVRRGQTQSEIMPLSTSLALQEHIHAIRTHAGRQA